MAPKADMVDPTRETTAVHEAGHAVIAAVSGVRFAYVTLCVVENFKGSDITIAGHIALAGDEVEFLTRMQASTDGCSLSGDARERCGRHVLMSLSGLIAETEAIGRGFQSEIAEGALLDVAVACSLVRVMLGQSFWMDGDRLTEPSDLNSDQERRLVELWGTCIGEVRAHQEQIYTVARELLTASVTESRVIEIIANRGEGDD